MVLSPIPPLHPGLCHAMDSAGEDIPLRHSPKNQNFALHKSPRSATVRTPSPYVWFRACIFTECGNLCNGIITFSDFVISPTKTSTGLVFRNRFISSCSWLKDENHAWIILKVKDLRSFSNTYELRSVCDHLLTRLLSKAYHVKLISHKLLLLTFSIIEWQSLKSVLCILPVNTHDIADTAKFKRSWNRTF